MKKYLLLVLTLTLAACGPSDYPQSTTTDQQQFRDDTEIDEDQLYQREEEVEDCDLDDMIEGDSDCYGSTYKPSKSNSSSSIRSNQIQNRTVYSSNSKKHSSLSSKTTPTVPVVPARTYSKSTTTTNSYSTPSSSTRAVSTPSRPRSK